MSISIRSKKHLQAQKLFLDKCDFLSTLLFPSSKFIIANPIVAIWKVVETQFARCHCSPESRRSTSGAPPRGPAAYRRTQCWPPFPACRLSAPISANQLCAVKRWSPARRPAAGPRCRSLLLEKVLTREKLYTTVKPVWTPEFQNYLKAGGSFPASRPTQRAAPPASEWPSLPVSDAAASVHIHLCSKPKKKKQVPVNLFDYSRWGGGALHCRDGRQIVRPWQGVLSLGCEDGPCTSRNITSPVCAGI